MARRKEMVVELAIRCCVAKCSNSDAPLTCLIDYLEQLRSRGWDRRSLSQIRYGVLKAIMDWAAGAHSTGAAQ